MNRVFTHGDMMAALRRIIDREPDAVLGALTLAALVLGLTVEQARQMARNEIRGYSEN